jgi:FkbM family methyltransferase
MKSYSQLGEDIFLFQNFLNVPRSDAVIVEIGAFDGLTYSNTLSYESLSRCICILVEPSPINARKIHLNRPSSSIHQVAVSRGYGLVEFTGHTPVSGVSNYLSLEYVNAWGLGQAERYKVLTVPLSGILELNNLKYVDFLSIDVQGGELDVLCSMNWDMRVGVICIELEGHDENRDAACRGLLHGMGYCFTRRLHISEFWYDPHYERRNALFDRDKKMPFEAFELVYFEKSWIEKLRNNFY